MTKYIIRVTRTGQIEIDDNTTKTGDICGNKGVKLVWEADARTVSSFSLLFEQYIKTAGVLRLEASWPFGQSGGSGTSAYAVDLEAGTVSSAKRFWGRLAAGTSVYRYTVTAKPRAGGGDVIVNPVIIVED